MMLHWLLYLLITSVHSHSWLECADYQADFDGQNFDYANCKGYSRDYYTLPYAGSFDIQEEKSARPDDGFECPQLLRSGASIEDHYNDEYPYAIYIPGETYRLVWPAKNHGIGEECGETTTFDAAMAIYVNPNVNPTSDLTSVDDAELIWDWHAEYLIENGLNEDDWISWQGVNGVPFANCEDYCADTDASPCWGDITIPTDMFEQSGFYTFIWYWEFSTLFVSCFEAYVDVDVDAYVSLDPNATDTTDSTIASTDSMYSSSTTVTTGSSGVGGYSTSSDGEDGGSTTTSDGGSSVVIWHAEISIEYTGASYNEETIVNSLNGLVAMYDDGDIVWEIISFYESSDNLYFNFTVETYTSNIEIVSELVNSNNNTICVTIENAFGDGSCTIGLDDYKINLYSVTVSTINSTVVVDVDSDIDIDIDIVGNRSDAINTNTQLVYTKCILSLFIIAITLFYH